MRKEELQKILEEAAEDGRTELDLSGIQLTALPSELDNLSQLTALYLVGNQLTALPSELGNLTQLTALSLQINRLAALPSGLGNLTQLRTLFMQNNQLTALPSELGNLSQLTALDLSDNQLTALPSELGNLTQLRTLSLSGNQLTALPSELGNLTQLKTLSLQNNRLTALPPELGNLSQLTALYLQDNRMTALPSELGNLTQLKTLYLQSNRLTELPSELGNLMQLTKLSLHGNRLTALPSELGCLTRLTALDLEGFQLTALPSELGNLTQLKTLYLQNNRLTALPSELGNLTQLTKLYLQNNRLTALPSELGNLSQLRTLSLSGNQLTALPSELGNLTQLTTLNLSDNQLAELPSELGNLTRLTTLNLDGNQLDDALATVAERGVEELLAYLGSLVDAEALYEAKLIFVGEGKVGKSCLLAALRGKEFVENLPTTHGIDIRRLDLPHPSLDKTLQLNAWDFGGQEVYRITHQFFYSKRSLYLVLWQPRMGPEQCDVRGWIERIQLRIGDEAKILIVATHCETEKRVARIDKQDLLRDHGNVIVGFHEIDSKTGAGIDELKTAISVAASQLPQMGDRMSKRWRAARDELRSLEDPQIPFETFRSICSEHELKSDETLTLGGLLHDLGDIVFFGDEEGLQDVVVLQPGWLTKAIGFVLEDPATNREYGVLDHGRLRSIWHDHGIEDRERYEPSLHPYFLRLMEEYDVSYRLEGEKSSLVAQLVPEVRPELSWTMEEPATLGEPKISLVCELAEEPPGLVPWMIVRTHRFASEPRRHWQRGMLLEYGNHGTALLELRRREFHIAVSAAWPNYFMSILQDTLEVLVQKRWPGLEMRFSVPCPSHIERGRRCRGRFPLKALYSYKAKGLEQLPCTSDCLSPFNIDELLTGFKASETQVRLERMERRQVGMANTLDGMESAAAKRHAALMRALAAEHRDCPRLFTLLPEEFDGWDLAKIGKTRQRLTLWCEYPDGPHPTCPIGSGGDGEYVWKSSKEWLEKIAPYANTIASALRTLLPIVGAGLKVAVDETLVKQVKPKIHLMEKVASTLLTGDLDLPDRPRDTDELVTRAEGSGLRELHLLLKERDPEKTWGHLKRVLAKTGEYLWLCPEHYREYEPDLPDLDSVN